MNTDCPCPKCDTTGEWLDEVSLTARVDYYRCPKCGHVWTVPKDDCEPARDVTVRRE